MKEIVPKYPPYIHQINAANFSKDKNFFAYFMEQGTGKSKTALMAIKERINSGEVDRILVICPNSVKNQWAGEVLEDHSLFEYSSLVYDGFKTKAKKKQFSELLKSNKLKVLVMHYEAFQTDGVNLWVKMFFDKGSPFIIVDESTKIKNPEANRTKKIIRGFRNRPYKCIMTGTPTPNSPVDLYAQFEFLKPGFWRMDYRSFISLFCIMVKKQNPNTGRPFNTPIDETTWWLIKKRMEKRLLDAGKEKPNLDDIEFIAFQNNTKARDVMIILNQEEYTPYKNLDKLWAMISDYTFTITKEQCLDLPDKVYEKIEVELTQEQKKALRDLKNHLMAEYEGKLLTAANKVAITKRAQSITGGLFPYSDIDTLVDGKLDLETKYKRMNKNPKIRALLDDLEEVSKETSIIVWAIFVEELKWIYEEIKKAGYSTELFYGGTSTKERDRIEDDFKKKRFQILVINPAVGEMGLNFQVSTLHYFYSNDYRADRRLQAEDRSHRSGQKNKVTYKDIVATNSVDQRILEVITRKEDLIKVFRNKPTKQFVDEIIF